MPSDGSGTVWSVGVWASGTWGDNVWGATGTSITAVGTQINPGQIHLADGSSGAVAVAGHVNPAQTHAGSSTFDTEIHLPLGVLLQVQALLAELLNSRVSGLDASQILLMTAVSAVFGALESGAPRDHVSDAIHVLRIWMLGAVPEFDFDTTDVVRISDADAHQQRILIEIVRLLKPYSLNP